MNSTAGDLSRLTTTLFDLRSTLEAELRMLTWVQRSLEGIRAGAPCGDVDLLLQEIARLFRESSASSDAAGDHRAAATGLVAALLEAHSAPRASGRLPLSVVAA